MNDIPALPDSREAMLRKPTDDLSTVAEALGSFDRNAHSGSSNGGSVDASHVESSGSGFAGAAATFRMKAAPEPLTEGGPARGRSEEKGSLGSDSSDSSDEEDEETLQGYDDPAMVGTRRAVCDAYLRGASGIVVVYDIGDAGTMDRLDGWLTRLEVRDLAEAVGTVQSRC